MTVLTSNWPSGPSYGCLVQILGEQSSNEYLEVAPLCDDKNLFLTLVTW